MSFAGISANASRTTSCDTSPNGPTSLKRDGQEQTDRQRGDAAEVHGVGVRERPAVQSEPPRRLEACAGLELCAAGVYEIVADVTRPTGRIELAPVSSPCGSGVAGLGRHYDPRRPGRDAMRVAPGRARAARHPVPRDRCPWQCPRRRAGSGRASGRSSIDSRRSDPVGAPLRRRSAPSTNADQSSRAIVRRLVMLLAIMTCVSANR